MTGLSSSRATCACWIGAQGICFAVGYSTSDICIFGIPQPVQQGKAACTDDVAVHTCSTMLMVACRLLMSRVAELFVLIERVKLEHNTPLAYAFLYSGCREQGQYLCQIQVQSVMFTGLWAALCGNIQVACSCHLLSD